MSLVKNCLLKFAASKKILQLIKCPQRYASNDACNSTEMRGLVVGVYETVGNVSGKLTSTGEKFNENIGGKLKDLIKDIGVSGKLGQGKVLSNVTDDFASVAVVGLGREGVGFNELEMIDEGMENARIAAGVGARALQYQGCTDIFVDSMEYPEQAAEGSGLAVWQCLENKSPKNRITIPKLEVYDSVDVDSWVRGMFKAEAQNLARRLTDLPGNQMTPIGFANAALDALCPCGVTVEIRNADWILQNQLNSFLAIAKGSCEPPVLLEITYCGTSPEDKPVLFLGKGITFNSGGLCLHKKRGMDEFRGAMAGGAVIVGAIRAAAALSLPINVSAIIPLCENFASGMAVKPGDVISLLNGKTMAIRNTQKAGVAVMADPLLYGQSNYKPRIIIDIGTMCNGVVKGLGASAAGLFSNSDYLWKSFQKAGSISGDRVWRLPLWRHFKHLVTRNPSYDLSNDGEGPASSCLAAAVLHELVPCVDWAHLDIRGVGMLAKHGTPPYLMNNRMTGRPTRTLVQFLTQLSCPESATK